MQLWCDTPALQLFISVQPLTGSISWLHSVCEAMFSTSLYWRRSSNLVMLLSNQKPAWMSLLPPQSAAVSHGVELIHLYVWHTDIHLYVSDAPLLSPSRTAFCNRNQSLDWDWDVKPHFLCSRTAKHGKKCFAQLKKWCGAVRENNRSLWVALVWPVAAVTFPCSPSACLSLGETAQTHCLGFSECVSYTFQNKQFTYSGWNTSSHWCFSWATTSTSSP